MILSKNVDDINTVYDFSEGIISEIKWDVGCIDLLIAINYNWDVPEGCKDQDLTIRFKNCSYANFDMKEAIVSMKVHNISSMWQEIESIHIDRASECFRVVIESNFSKKMIELSCEEIRIEKGNCYEVL